MAIFADFVVERNYLIDGRIVGDENDGYLFSKNNLNSGHGRVSTMNEIRKYLYIITE